MSDTMIERVARAMLAGHDWTVDGQPGEKTGWDAMPHDWQDAYRGMARAAIQAMAEPTEAMSTVGVNEFWSECGGADLGGSFSAPDTVSRVYRGMIAAALSEGEGK